MSAANTPSGPRPPAPVQGPRPSAVAVTGAIRKASQSTGASFEYLLATAKVESDLNPNLTMRSSSATGLFQFIDQTWLGVMKTAGRAFGFERYADAITQTSSGKYVVDDPALRDEMMKLRKDPSVNAAMGGVFTQQNAAQVKKRIGRQPTDGELYVAHFFGPYAGAKVIEMAKSNPTANASEIFPAAAAANKPIFYDKQGNARSVAGVYNELVRRYQVARARPTPGLEPMVASATTPAGNTTQTTASIPASSTQPTSAPLSLTPPSLAPVAATSRTTTPSPAAVAPSRPLRATPGAIPAAAAPDTAGITAAYAAAEVVPARAATKSELPEQITRPSFVPFTARSGESTSAFHSLFETEGSRGPLSPAVAELWGGAAARERALQAPALPSATDEAISPPGLPVTDGMSGAADVPGAPLDLLPAMRPGARRFDSRR